MEENKTRIEMEFVDNDEQEETTDITEAKDRALGSFKQEDLFRVMARIFLNIGFERWAMKS